MLRNWITRLRQDASLRSECAGRRRASRRRATSIAAAVRGTESLEGRCLLTNFVVTTLEDGSLVPDGQISLREAIEAANTNLPSVDAPAGEAGPGTVDTITFDASLSGQTITLNGASLLIADDLTISDSNSTAITIDAGGSSRVFEIANGANAVSISDITITGGAASSGGGILVTDGESLTLTDVTISSNAATGATSTEGGGGIFNNGGTLNISGSTISGNTALGTAGSGGGVLTSGGTVTISNTTISGNAASRAGGGIEDQSGAGLGLTLDTVNLDNNVAGLGPGNGGGLHVTGAGNVNITGGQVTGNFATSEGGGLWNGTGTMTISGGTLIDANGAAGGGADQGGGGIFSAGGTVTIESITISNNVATGGATFSLSGDQEVPSVSTSASGSAAFQLNPDADTFDFLMHISGIAAADVTGVHIHVGAAGSNGGVIVNLLDFGSFTEVNGMLRLALHDIFFPPEFEDQLFADGAYVNVHTSDHPGGELRGQITFPATMGSGGGIFNDGGTLSVQFSPIRNNMAARAGGGIETNGGTVTLEGMDLERNYAGVVGPATPGNGGGLHVTGNGNVTIRTTEVFQNFAAAEGGGLWNGSGTMNLNFATAIAQNGSYGAGVDQGGGGVFNAGGTLNLDRARIDRNITFGSTTVDLSGAQEVPAVTTSVTGNANIIYRANGRFRVNLFVSGVELTDASALPELTGAHIHLGAPGTNGPVIADLMDFGNFVQEENGVRRIGNDFIFTGDNLEAFLSGNTYINIHTTDHPSGEVRGQITFDSIGGSGGGILNDGGSLNVHDTRILLNVAARAGGGIETNGGSVIVTAGGLQANTAGVTGASVPGNGGGLHVTGSATVGLSSLSVFDNAAANDGGGIWNSANGTMAISNVDVITNSAVRGGGVYLQGGGTGTTTINDFSLLDGNTATGSDSTDGGGGLYVDGATVDIDNVRIESNESAGSSGAGGGIFNHGGTLNINDASITSNSAMRGGGVSVRGGTATLTAVIIQNNAATGGPSDGGGLQLSDEAVVTLHNNLIRFNTAMNAGGGVWNSGNGTLTVRNSTIIDNATGFAARGGGLFTAQGGNTLLTNTIVASNDSGSGPRADDIAGASLSGSSSFNLIGDAGTSGGLTDGTNGNIVGNGGSGTIDLATVVDSLGRPISGSPVIDAGTDLSGVGITSDLRGDPRPQSIAFDIGAYEADVDTAAGIRVSVDDAPLVTEGGNVVFTVRINRDPDSDVTLDAATVEFTATDGADYSGVSQSLTFQPGGGLSRTIVVNTTDDVIPEDPERFFLRLTNLQGGIFDNDSAAATLLDNDAGGRPVLDPIDRFPSANPPQLSWQGVAGAVQYEVWLARIAPDQRRLFVGQSLTSTTTYTPPEVLTAGVYRYWVRGIDSSNNTTPWSLSSNTFEVKPTLIGPLSPTLDPRPTFSWDAIHGTSGYQIFIRTVSGDIIVDNIQGTTFTPSQNLAKGPIRWWIRSSDAVGNTGWSDVGLTDVRTTVLSPTGTTSDLTPTITWQAVENAGRYIVYLQRIGTNFVLREDAATGTSHTFSTALSSGNYRVWVKAIDADSNSFQSGLWSRPLDFSVADTEEHSRAEQSLIMLTSLQRSKDLETEHKSDNLPAVPVDPTLTNSEPAKRRAGVHVRPASTDQTKVTERGPVLSDAAVDLWMADPEALAALLQE